MGFEWWSSREAWLPPEVTLELFSWSSWNYSVFFLYGNVFPSSLNRSCYASWVWRAHKICKVNISGKRFAGDEGVLAGVHTRRPPGSPSVHSVDRPVQRWVKLALLFLPERFLFSDKRIRGGLRLTYNWKSARCCQHRRFWRAGLFLLEFKDFWAKRVFLLVV